MENVSPDCRDEGFPWIVVEPENRLVIDPMLKLCGVAPLELFFIPTVNTAMIIEISQPEEIFLLLVSCAIRISPFMVEVGYVGFAGPLQFEAAVLALAEVRDVVIGAVPGCTIGGVFKASAKASGTVVVIHLCCDQLARIFQIGYKWTILADSAAERLDFHVIST